MYRPMSNDIFIPEDPYYVVPLGEDLHSFFYRDTGFSG